jgi:MYXO-CTERM domain-containing protein
MAIEIYLRTPSANRTPSRPPFRWSPSAACAGFAALLASASLAGSASAKPFMDYVKPMPPVAPLSSNSWGVAGVLPRDLSNGIESAKGAGVHPDYYYWDGQIIRASDGKYHLFMSTFSGNTNFGTSWFDSDAYHAVSQTNVLGPYQRQDYIYDNNGSHKGHNVTALELPDGKYAVVVSETVPFTIYTSSSLDGPWTGCQPTSQVGASNISLVPRHDGKFQIVERNGTIAISDTLCGTYVKQTPTCAYTQNAADSIYPKRTSIPNVPNPAYTWQEDPHIWRSGGVYHVIYSGSGDRVGWHVHSTDGLNWEDNGYAWSPREYQKIFCYEGTNTCNQWYKMERPGVVLQDGHPTHITWAVADVDKDNQVLPGSNHGTKIIVVPFDGVAFDNDFGVDGSGGAGGAGTGGTESGGAGSGGASGGAGGNSGTAGTGGLANGGGGGSISGGTGGQGATAGASTGAGGTVSAGGNVNGGAGAHSMAGAPAVGGTSGASNADAGPDGGGCGCRVAGGPMPSKPLAILGVVSLFGLRRSRRRTNR